MTLNIERDWIYLDCSPKQAQKLDAVWVKSRGKYRLPNTLGALRELYKMGFTEVKDYGVHKALELKQAKQLKDSDPQDYGLRYYQNQDIEFLKTIPHAGVFNEMRLGKTPMSLKLFEEEGRKKNLVVCPASLVFNWANEVKKFTDKTPFPVHGTKKKRLEIYEAFKEASEGYLIISKDTLRSDLNILDMEFEGLICDEAHFLNSPRTAQSKAVFKIGKKANKRLALTGTPVRNSVDEIWGILHFLYYEKYPSYWQFIDRYFKSWETPWGSREPGKLKREQELTMELELVSVQRKRKEVFEWLPEKIYQTIELEMGTKQRKAYDDMLSMFTVMDGNEVIVDAPSVLAQLTRLRQICLDPKLLDIQAPSAKETFIKEWLSDNSHNAVIIFSNFSSYLNRLHREIKGSKIIIGETSKQDRQKAVEDFQEGKCNVLFANIKAAGTGLTLDRADTVIFLDRAYTPSENSQAEDRAVATTEDSNLNTLIIDLVCKDSIDEHINKILNKKQSIIEVVNNYKNIGELLK